VLSIEPSGTDFEAITSPTFIEEYTSRFGIHRILETDLISSSEQDGKFVEQGGSSEIFLYAWKIEIEVLESYGHYDNITEQITFSKDLKTELPLIKSVEVEVLVKKIVMTPVIPNFYLPAAQFLNEIQKLHFFQKTKSAFDDCAEPNVIHFYGYCYGSSYSEAQDCDVPYYWIVMEHAEKGSLNHAMIENLTRIERIFVSLEICKAIDFLHESGIAHGDLKPDNIVLSATGRCKLVDFGSSVFSFENFFLFSRAQFHSLRKDKASNIFDYMPAIVQVSTDRFKFVLDGLNGHSQRRIKPGKPGVLQEVVCPKNLILMVQSIFSRAQQPHCESDGILAIAISSEHAIVRYLSGIGYGSSIPEKILGESFCCGSPLWLAPELCQCFYFGRNHPNIDFSCLRPNFSTDIYSLAIILYEIWTGEKPYNSYTSVGSIIEFYREVVERNLRPTIHTMCCESGLVEACSLKSESKIGELKTLIEAGWDAVPSKRPSIAMLRNFFSTWIDEIVVEYILSNQVKPLEEILENLQDTRCILMEREFKDHPYRTPRKISLLQYALWALSDDTMLQMLLKFVTKKQLDLQFDSLLKSNWVTENGRNSISIIGKLLQAYACFQEAQEDQIKKQWGQIGLCQRQLPQRMFLRYCSLRKTHDQDSVVPSHDRQYVPENQEHAWYEKPSAKLTGAKLLFHFSACYYTKERGICRKDILNSDAKAQSFEGLDIGREITVFKKLLEEVRAVDNVIRESIRSHSKFDA